jgi:hypothetical protein
MIDWVQLLDSLGVECQLGPKKNTRAGHVGIQCPLCDSDSKFHFSIELKSGKVRGCWRDRSHWLSPTALVAQLASVSYGRAKDILDQGELPVLINTGSLLKRIEALDVEEEGTRLKSCPLRPEFKSFQRGDGRTRQEDRFRDYLWDRGFDQLTQMAEEYQLRWCMDGEWTHRLVVPLLWDDGRIVGWTARAITEAAKLRYRIAPTGDAAQDLLWVPRADEDMAGSVLVVQEGPVDAWKIDWYGIDVDEGIASVALLTNSAGPGKIRRIARIAERYDRVVVVPDRGAEAQGMAVQASLRVLGAELITIPPQFKDVGEMGAQDVRTFVSSFI